jgi:DNA-binding NarL/FixJ family response regulator/cellobiose-specific phosphotransferase system component IIA
MNGALLSPQPAERTDDYSRVVALVVDENAAARMAMKSMLQQIGVSQVQQANDPIRAIRLMEMESFGLVLCEARFGSQMDGCQVLEYVRTRRLLAPSAAFVLVSGDADRTLVFAVREWQPDGFVLKPLTAAALAPRIEQALRTRRVRAPLYEAAERNDSEAVLVQARRIAKELGGPSLELLRWQAQALIDLGRPWQAREVCEQAHGFKRDLPWAEVVLAHCERAEGKVDAACDRLRATIRDHPFMGGAYDLLIEVLQEQGETGAALDVARSALEQLATSQRMRTLGEIAYAHGELETAEECYTDLIRKTSTSLTRSPLDVGMLGQVFVTQGDADKALRLVSSVQGNNDAPGQALAASVQAQAHSAKGDAVAAEAAARKAIELAGMATPSESVSMLVAQGAFTAGLRDEGEALVDRAMRTRKRPGAPGALARKVLADAGLSIEAYAEAAAPAVGAAPTPSAPSAPTAEGTAASDVSQALDCLHHARFDEARSHVDRARACLPSNPMVLMATVQVYLLRMRALGYDDEAARLVRRCLAEIDRQVPGEDRVFRFSGD